LDEHKKGELDRTDLRLIVGESVRLKESDLSILMSHFGDGKAITAESLKEVMDIQKAI
jgi:ribose 5-phosphate isomerase RpiB